MKGEERVVNGEGGKEKGRRGGGKKGERKGKEREERDEIIG